MWIHSKHWTTYEPLIFTAVHMLSEKHKGDEKKNMYSKIIELVIIFTFIMERKKDGTSKPESLVFTRNNLSTLFIILH